MFKKDNDQNWLDRNLKYFFGVSVIPAFGFVSDFGFRASNFDEFVKSRKIPFFVIPAEAGIQSNQGIWTPAFAGVTALGTFYEPVNF